MGVGFAGRPAGGSSLSTNSHHSICNTKENVTLVIKHRRVRHPTINVNKSTQQPRHISLQEKCYIRINCALSTANAIKHNERNFQNLEKILYPCTKIFGGDLMAGSVSHSSVNTNNTHKQRDACVFICFCPFTLFTFLYSP